MSRYCHTLYTFLEKEKRRLYDKLCDLIAFTTKMSESYYIPQERHELMETLSSLDSIDLITFLNTPSSSWVIFDKKVLLCDINGVLFAPTETSRRYPIASNTGEIL